MDILKSLSEEVSYGEVSLQAIVGAWVLAAPFEGRGRVSETNGHVEEADYDKRSIYSILYAIYRSTGEIRSDRGVPYEFTFNTWGYAWPDRWGPAPTPESEPQRFGRNAYSGLYHFSELRDFVDARGGQVHVVELGCGTGAGADHTCASVLPQCTYEAFDMQAAGIATANRRFVPRSGGRLVATRADATQLPVKDGAAQIAAVCETHVTDQGAALTTEDQAFFRSAHRVLDPGGYLVWGNAIPAPAWKHAFEYLDSIGMELREVVDVTDEAVRARHEDAARIEAYIEQALDGFAALRLPIFGSRRRREAEFAMKNLCRHPGTQLFDDMASRRDLYQVALLRKRSS